MERERAFVNGNILQETATNAGFNGRGRRRNLLPRTILWTHGRKKVEEVAKPKRPVCLFLYSWGIFNWRKTDDVTVVFIMPHSLSVCSSPRDLGGKCMDASGIFDNFEQQRRTLWFLYFGIISWSLSTQFLNYGLPMVCLVWFYSFVVVGKVIL